MPSIFRVFRRDGNSRSKKNLEANNVVAPPKPNWEEAWSRTEVQPEEIQKLISVCTHEMKSRALDMPFLLLPFRPGLDPIGSKNFVRQYFKVRYDEGEYREPDSKRSESFARRELRLMEPIVLCSIMKWCWARLPGGVVTWETYELFKSAEVDSKMSKNAFDVFIPLSTDSDARKEIIYDFFDLLAAVSARGKTNGLGGRKLSRYAGWWAFQHSDQGKGFDGGYKSWANAADATSHLFFAYLRSLAPDQGPTVSGISKLPRSLQALLSQTEYPPEAPSLMQSATTKVVMIVQDVSPTPFALLRRARNFEYRDDDHALQEFSDYEDPIRALTDECRRVLDCISATNQSAVPSNGTAVQDPSWSRFEDMGFGNFSDSMASPGDLANPGSTGIRSGPGSVTNDLGRPTTPSWADFLSTGFPADRSPTLLPPDKQIPMMGGPRAHSSQSHRPMGGIADLEPGELASIAHFDLDETFWWVWMTSLAAEEPAERKAVFGRCALIETHIRGAHWLLMEEQVKGASPGQEEGAYIAEKKSRFSFTRRGRLSRKKTTMKKKEKSSQESLDRDLAATPSSRISPEKHQKLQAAAIRLAKGETPADMENSVQRRSRLDADSASKTNSTMTVGNFLNEAGAALKWTNHYDSGNLKDDIRQQYLQDPHAGTGKGYGNSTSAIDLTSNGARTPVQRELSNRDLPALPTEEEPDKIERTPTRPVTPPPAPVPSSASPVHVLADDKMPPEGQHPALRTPDDSPPPAKSKPLIAPSPEVKKLSPPKEHKKLQKKDPAGGGFKKLFGRKKSVMEKQPRQNPLLEGKPAAKAPISRPIIVPEVSRAPEPIPDRVPDSPPRSVHEEPTFNAPPMQHDSHDDQQERDEARREALERLEADREFSRFDQGPIEDVPAFVPEDEPYDDGDDDAAAPPPVIKRAANNRIPVKVHREPDYSSPTSQALGKKPVHSHNMSETSVDQPTGADTSSPSDRWAQIRKNAAERAQRLNDASDAQHHGRNPSASARSDDGDTSGEETIESRVARIKARVAELTGNMDASTTAPRVH
ncbi:hypothetical protein BT63DRAFT_449446 [Microthyrium microscopicum]|uniref:Meiotically up-regulated protein Msb1/Mug8 domain-containing protein n=1 Tax=Microthyrium microscopicum TaxID=703497 RepID=A0A6A6UQ81_9PEZI|nr:hypothetical protein BT63DRAFT_449446 [Microthyrium microscopicum]